MTSHVNEVTLLSLRHRSVKGTSCESTSEKAGLTPRRTKSNLFPVHLHCQRTLFISFTMQSYEACPNSLFVISIKRLFTLKIVHL